MSTVDIVHESPAFSFPTSLPTNVTMSANIVQEEFWWLCVLVCSLGIFAVASLKRKT